MNNELISVVIIVYNTEKYIRECIESVINQTYKNIEIVIVNDGSKDNSVNIINEYVKKDNRIVFIDRKINKGTMYTRIEGYNKSSGKYIFFLDSDDFIEENALELMYNSLKNNDVDVVKCNFKKFKNGEYIYIKNEINELTKITKDEFEPKLYNLLYKTIYLNSMCGQLVKKELLCDINKIDSTSIYGEDIQSNLYLFEKINSILFLPDCLYVYRINENSITNTINYEKLQKKLDDSIKCYYNMNCFIDKTNMHNKDYYKSLVSEKMLNYITSVFIDFTKVKKINFIKKELNRIITNQQVSFVLKNYNNSNDLNVRKIYKICENYIYENKPYKFYFYTKLIYNPIYKLWKILK